MKKYKFTISRIQFQTHDFIIIGDDYSHIDTQELYDKAFNVATDSNWRNFTDGNVDYQIEHIEEL